MTVAPHSGIVDFGTFTPPRFMGCALRRLFNGATGADGNINWDAHDYDTDGFHDDAVNNQLITIPTGLGIKKVSLLANWTSTSATYGLGNIQRNGTSLSVTYGADAFGNKSTFQAFDSIAADGDLFTYNKPADLTVIDASAAFFQMRVNQIDAQGFVGIRYGAVEIEKIDTNEWAFVGGPIA
jgi:hypothetical protein